MSNITIEVLAGGVFSKFMCIVQNIQKINPNFESLYISNIDEKSLINEENIFNNIFDQKIKENQILYGSTNLHSYSKFNPIELSTNFSDYKKIVTKLKFTENFNKKFNSYLEKLNIDENYIGVHIRLCDMNIYHASDYGILSFDDFLNEIQKLKDNGKKIFVASDNNESILKLKSIFNDDVVYLDGFLRGEYETEDTLMLQSNNFKDIRFWEEAFIEMLFLSRCGTLICRSSNLSNASIIYSNTLKKIIRL
jgi:uncharacterized protein YktA (UPF0223 family)